MSQFQYISKCCAAKATKPPCIKSKDADSTLGTWLCGKCGKPCKVSRKNERDTIKSG
jgi:hypothetical protein